MKNLTKLFLIVCISFIVWNGDASAFVVDLTYPNVSGMPTMTYATVTGTVDSSDNTIFHFTVNLATDLGFLNQGDNFGMDKFFFNTDLGLTSANFINLPSLWNIRFNQNADGFGSFIIEVAGGGNSRVPSLSFDIDYSNALTESNFYVLSTGTAGSGHGHFAHI